MGNIISEVTDFVGLTDTGAPKEAAKLSADYQNRALEYLKQKEEIPSQFKEEALTGLAGLLGLPGGTGEALISPQLQSISGDEIKGSSVFDALMGTIPGAQEAVLSKAAATGGLRSGNVQDALARTTSDIERQAILDSLGYLTSERDKQIALEESNIGRQLGGLQMLMGQQSYAPQIASGISGVGQTLAQGQLGSSQAQQQAIGDVASLAAMAFSDPQLKNNITKIGERNGFGWYEWDWNEKAKDLGLTGKSQGYMANEVKQKAPEAIGEKDGYLTINYEMVDKLHG